MSITAIGGPVIQYPPLFVHGNIGGITATIDANDERLHMVGQVYLEGGSGTKTLNSSGFIGFRAGTITFATASTTFTIGIQDVSAATAPAQGDGTFDVYATLVAGTDTISTNWNKIQMETGTKDLTHGQLIAVVLEITNRAGADSVTATFAGGIPNSNNLGAYQSTVQLQTGVSTFATQSAIPNCMIEFSDGTRGWLAWSSVFSNTSTSQQYASNTGTADEYGTLITVPVNCVAAGIAASILLDGTSADFELCLYSDPLGTPVLIEAITVDATQCGATGSQRTINALFSTRRQLTANTPYAVTVRPTTTNTLRSFYFDVNEAADWKAWGTTLDCYAVRRLDNTGAFSDYNGGTAKTRRMITSLLLDAFDNGTGMGNASLNIGL